jgi:Fic family protein
MIWNWQQPDWPQFTWDGSGVRKAEQDFLVGGGILVGTVKHLLDEESDQLTVEAMTSEAVTTSEIEGEFLDRASVQSSIRRQLGLAADKQRPKPAEQGVAEMMVNLYRSIAAPLTEDMLFGWHRMLMAGPRGLGDPGRYRTSAEPMQIISGPAGKPKVHFEAPPSSQVGAEMDRFLDWFSRTGPGASDALPALTRAGIAHLYFESIHPFEDGNGRIGRAIAEKALAQSLNQPMLTALAATILARRKGYYEALSAASRRNEITGWLVWFAETAVEAQRRTFALTEFVIEKSKLFRRLKGRMNDRQEKALARMFSEGPQGFKGGMSAGKYATITGASPATATRDLVDLVEKGALIREGELRYARYHLSLPSRVAGQVARR